jgi:signal transduction histidine kinase
MSQPVAELTSALRTDREEIIFRWLQRIADRVTVEREFVFPSETLIDHVPLLIEGLCDYIAGAPEVEIVADSPVISKARELGSLRFKQGFSPRQILWEYEILGAILLEHLRETLCIDVLPDTFVKRLFHAMATLQRATVEAYLDLADTRVAEREERLRSFNRAVSHELRNEAGAILGAGRMLKESFVRSDPQLLDKFTNIILDNGERVERVLANLLELSRLETDTRTHRRVMLSHAASEVIRRLRGYAEVNRVRLELLPSECDLEVNAATVDLALTNLVANGIKYCREDENDRWVRVRASLHSSPDRVFIEVEDNGRGVTEADRPHLFQRFFRSSNAADVEGTGLGLSLVREAVERAGGRAWAEFTPEGFTTFCITLPARRVEDRSPAAQDEA